MNTSGSAGAEVIVGGAGASGRAAAFRLQEAGFVVRVLEATDRAGGPMATKERDGFLLDQGAIFLPTTYRNLLGLAKDAGIDGEIVPGGFVFGLVRDGHVHQIDGDHPARDFARTEFLSPLGRPHDSRPRCSKPARPLSTASWKPVHSTPAPLVSGRRQRCPGKYRTI